MKRANDCDSGHRKTVRHFHTPGDCHELTFSCYRRMALLTNDLWRGMLCKAIDRALDNHSFRLAAFVIMPEHVHLLVYPTSEQPDVPQRLAGLLSGIKRPFSVRIKQILVDRGSRLLDRLTVRERPGKTAFRFWQEGPGYDRNLTGPRSVLAAIDYIHLNPVRRGLVQRVLDWRWSSARHYLDSVATPGPELPTVYDLPADYLNENAS